MPEKRKVTRRQVRQSDEMVVIYGGSRKALKVLDISPGGMRVSLPEPLKVGADIFGRVTIYPDVEPFYIAGKVVRTASSDGVNEAAIKFEKVRVHSFFGAPL